LVSISFSIIAVKSFILPPVNLPLKHELNKIFLL
jgi:hypothetical protein